MKIRKPRDMRRANKLTYAREWALKIGDDPVKPAFENREEMREAWFAHRHEFGSPNPGTRWTGWWLFEADGKDRNGLAGLLFLIENGELTGGEAKVLQGWGAGYWPPEAEAAWLARVGGDDV